MNAPLIWHDPIVAEIHAIRAELAMEYADDLEAYSTAAVAHCRQLNFQVSAAPVMPPALNERGTSEAAAKTT